MLPKFILLYFCLSFVSVSWVGSTPVHPVDTKEESEHICSNGKARDVTVTVHIKDIDLDTKNESSNGGVKHSCCSGLQKRLSAIEEFLSNMNLSLKQPLQPTQNSTKLRNCKEILDSGFSTSGVYTIDLRDGGSPFKVYCDMETDGGGWTVFQRRKDGSVNFYRDWNDYKNGFGNLKEEFWLGLDKISRLTKASQNVLRFDMSDFDGNSRYALYNVFTVGDENSGYVLTSGGYSGNAGDSFRGGRHKGYKFSTKDRDNDGSSGHCSNMYKGGWWYGACHNSNLNGQYLKGPHSSYADGINWRYWRGYRYSLKFTEMKVRPN